MGRARGNGLLLHQHGLSAPVRARVAQFHLTRALWSSHNPPAGKQNLCQATCLVPGSSQIIRRILIMLPSAAGPILGVKGPVSAMVHIPDVKQGKVKQNLGAGRTMQPSSITLTHFLQETSLVTNLHRVIPWCSHQFDPGGSSLWQWHPCTWVRKTPDVWSQASQSGRGQGWHNQAFGNPCHQDKVLVHAATPHSRKQ